MLLYELNKQVIHLDFEYCDKPESYPFTLLYFTGSGEFNKKMRIIAKKKGYKLSEYGLFDKNNHIIKVSSERDIFKTLDMEYLQPRLR
jgi:DNA polymerase/3'-5' exonuclease PolX